MRKLVFPVVLSLSLCMQAQVKKAGGYPITPVPFTSVQVTDSFWGQRTQGEP